MAQSAALIFLRNILFPNGDFNSDIKKILSSNNKKFWTDKCQNKCQKCFKNKEL